MRLASIASMTFMNCLYQDLENPHERISSPKWHLKQLIHPFAKNQLQTTAYLMGSNSFESMNRFAIEYWCQNCKVAKQNLIQAHKKYEKWFVSLLLICQNTNANISSICAVKIYCNGNIIPSITNYLILT